MTISKQLFEEDERRLSKIRDIGIECGALVPDEGEARNDAIAERRLYAKVFQAWAENVIHGTAEQIFDTIQEALDV